MGYIFYINSGWVKHFPKIAYTNRGENDYNPNVVVSLKYEKLYASKLFMNNGFQFKVIR